VLRRSPRHSTEKRIRNFDRSYAPAVALSQVLADRWPSSNDSQPHNSNFVLHRSWPPLHEITRPHTATVGALQSVSPKRVSVTPDIFFLSPPWLTSAIALSLHRCPSSSSTGLDDSRELLHPSLAPFNLHKSRVRRASGFLLTAFSNATPHTFFQP
jgi:hypothetical protein